MGLSPISVFSTKDIADAVDNFLLLSRLRLEYSPPPLLVGAGELVKPSKLLLPLESRGGGGGGDITPRFMDSIL